MYHNNKIIKQRSISPLCFFLPLVPVSSDLFPPLKQDLGFPRSGSRGFLQKNSYFESCCTLKFTTLVSKIKVFRI